MKWNTGLKPESLNTTQRTSTSRYGRCVTSGSNRFHSKPRHRHTMVIDLRTLWTWDMTQQLTAVSAKWDRKCWWANIFTCLPTNCHPGMRTVACPLGCSGIWIFSSFVLSIASLYFPQSLSYLPLEIFTVHNIAVMNQHTSKLFC